MYCWNNCVVTHVQRRKYFFASIWFNPLTELNNRTDEFSMVVIMAKLELESLSPVVDNGALDGLCSDWWVSRSKQSNEEGLYANRYCDGHGASE